MSVTYTRWVHHGEAVNVNVIDYVEAEDHHLDLPDAQVEEEEEEVVVVAHARAASCCPPGLAYSAGCWWQRGAAGRSAHSRIQRAEPAAEQQEMAVI